MIYYMTVPMAEIQRALNNGETILFKVCTMFGTPLVTVNATYKRGTQGINGVVLAMAQLIDGKPYVPGAAFRASTLDTWIMDVTDMIDLHGWGYPMVRTA